jgi:hypothetical protein
VSGRDMTELCLEMEVGTAAFVSMSPMGRSKAGVPATFAARLSPSSGHAHHSRNLRRQPGCLISYFFVCPS